MMSVPVIKVVKIEEKDAVARRPPPGECWGERHTFVLMAFLGYTLCFTLRVDLAVAIVAMVNTTSTTADGPAAEQCPPVGAQGANEGSVCTVIIGYFDTLALEQAYKV